MLERACSHVHAPCPTIRRAPSHGTRTARRLVSSQKLSGDELAAQADGETTKLLRMLKEGDYFGERAILYDEVRSATVTAASRVRLLRIAKKDFVELLGSIHEELLRRASKLIMQPKEAKATADPSPTGARGGSDARDNSSEKPTGESGAPNGGAAAGPNGAGSSSSRARRAPPVSGLKQITMLGSGGYGRVSLVRDGKTRRVFALKRVCKDHLLAHNGAMRCEWLLREKQILEELDHPFIVSVRGRATRGAQVPARAVHRAPLRSLRTLRATGARHLRRRQEPLPAPRRRARRRPLPAPRPV